MLSRRRFLALSGGSAALSACSSHAGSILPAARPVEPAVATTPAPLTIGRIRTLAAAAAPPATVPNWRFAVEGYATPFCVTDHERGVSIRTRGLPYQNYSAVDITCLTSPSLGVLYHGFGSNTVQDATAAVNAADATVSSQGSTWNASAHISPIPSRFPSGIYNAHLTTYYDSQWELGDTNDVRFVIQEKTPGIRSKILVMTGDSTYAAYAQYGGSGFYSDPKSPFVAYRSPNAGVNNYEILFGEWLARNGIAVEWCSTAQLHAQPTLLSHYSTFVSVGHDEYWSLSMRNQVEAFIARGGNAAFFSGNTSMWQIRFEGTDLQQIVCYKEDQSGVMDPVRDPLQGGPTVEWWNPLLGRPSNQMTGSGYLSGAGWYDTQDGYTDPSRTRGYTIQNASHWIFGGTGLAEGDTLGQGTNADNSIIGYETDAADYTMVNGKAVPTCTDGTPSTYEILGYCTLDDWASHGKGGNATMGYMKLGNGHVFSAGTVNWAGGLTQGGTSPVDIITKNVLTNFRDNTSVLG